MPATSRPEAGPACAARPAVPFRAFSMASLHSCTVRGAPPATDHIPGDAKNLDAGPASPHLLRASQGLTRPGDDVQQKAAKFLTGSGYRYHLNDIDQRLRLPPCARCGVACDRRIRRFGAVQVMHRLLATAGRRLSFSRPSSKSLPRGRAAFATPFSVQWAVPGGRRRAVNLCAFDQKPPKFSGQGFRPRFPTGSGVGWRARSVEALRAASAGSQHRRNASILSGQILIGQF